MPPITFEKLLELNRQKKDLYNQKEELTRFLQAFQRAVRNCDAFKFNRRKAETFADHIFHAKLDPTSREEYTEQEKRRHRFYPQEPKRPLKLVNRDTIENAVSDLEELGDFLGSKVKGEDTNVCDYILRNADYDDAEDIEKGLHIINDTLQLGIPMEQLLAGKEIKATDEEKSARSKRKTELKKQQQRRNEAFEAEVQKVENFHTDRKLASKAIDDRQRKEDEEEFKRNIEKRDKERKEKERIEQEKRKSAEQKKKEEAERKEAERKDQLKKQEAMREGIEKSVAVYRDPKTPAELKKVQMAMAAAFQAELDRVGPDGNTAIDETRIKENMESYYNSAAFALAEAGGDLEQLTQKTPKELLTSITEKEREAAAFCVDGERKDRTRAEKLWRQFDATWRIKKNSVQFDKARDAMRKIGEPEGAVTRNENLVAGEAVKQYIGKNINKAKSETGRKRMAISLAFLKQTMTKESFEAYCRSLNGQRGFVPAVNKDGEPAYDAATVAQERFIDPRLVGTVDEVYKETKERLSLVSQDKAALDPRDLAIMTAVAALKKKGSGDLAVEPAALQEEIRKIQSDKRFRDAVNKDGAKDLVDKAWNGQLDTLEGYSRPAPQDPQMQI